MKVTFGTTLSTFGNDIKIEFADNGYALCDAAWKQENARIPHSRLFYIIDGEAEILNGEERILLQPKKTYFIPFDFPFCCDCKDSLEKLFFHFNIPFLGKLDLFEGYDKIISFPNENIEEMARLFHNPTISNTAKLKSLIFADAVKVMELTGNFDKPLKPYSKVVEKAIKYIDSHISARLTVKEVAKNLFVSESQISRKFSNEIGLSMGKYITGKLILEIKFCLINSELTTDEICERFDFCDKSYYIRVFKAKTGFTPHKFKKRITIRRYEKLP